MAFQIYLYITKCDKTTALMLTDYLLTRYPCRRIFVKFVWATCIFVCISDNKVMNSLDVQVQCRCGSLYLSLCVSKVHFVKRLDAQRCNLFRNNYWHPGILYFTVCQPPFLQHIPDDQYTAFSLGELGTDPISYRRPVNAPVFLDISKRDKEL